ncbi:hypothetical protein D9M70_597350 [compost metagenome]
MRIAPTLRRGDANLVDTLPKVQRRQGHRHPAHAVGRLDLHPVDEAAFGKLHIVVVHEHIGQSHLLQQADPGEQHRLGNDDTGGGRHDQALPRVLMP